VRRRQVKVEALGITAEDVLRRFGMRNQLISTFKSLDVWIDPSGSLDDAAVSHWLEVRGRDAWIALDAYVQKGDGMERLQIRGSLGDALDAMRAWGSGLLSAR